MLSSGRCFLYMLYKVALKFEFVGAILVLLCNKGKLLSSNLL